MANEIIGAELRLESGNVNQTIGSLRAQLRQATEDVVTMSEQFGSMSTEAAQAAQRAAGLRDAIQDAASLTEAFNPDQKFAAFGQALSGVAGGFAAVQGAMALVGVESEEVEKTLVKVQAAMALSQGLNTVLDSIQGFKNLAAVLRQIPVIQRATAVANTLAATTMRAFGVATTQTSVAFKVLRGAIIATGIGALIVAIGFLIEKMMALKQSAEDADKAYENLGKAISTFNNKVNRDAIEKSKNEEELRIAKQKAEGKSDEEIFKTKQHYSNEQLDLKRKELAKLLPWQQEHRDLQKEIAQDEHDFKVAKINEEGRIRERALQKQIAAAKAQPKDDGEAKRLAAEALQIQKDTSDALALLNATAQQKAEFELGQSYLKQRNILIAAKKDTADLTRLYEANMQSIADQYRAEELEKDAEHKASLKESARSFMAEKAAMMAEDLRKEQELKEAKVKLAEEERNAKVRAYRELAQALDNFAALAGEQTAAGKTLAIASTAISTYLSAQEAFRGMVQTFPGPWGIAAGVVAAAGAVAAGIANVKRIVAVKIPGQGGGGSAPSMAGGGMSPLSPQPQTTKLDQQSINQMGGVMNNGTIKAVVVESDITESQNRINRINNAATFR